MTNAQDANIIQSFAEDIAVKLNEAAIIARTASSFSSQGLSDRAFDTLLGIETLINEASVLLNASSIVRRRDREKDAPFS